MLPLHPELKAVLDASPLGNGSFIGMSANAFDKAFRRACRAAGVKGSAHGLRKAAATRLAEAGASVLELNAIFGWTGSKMAMKYCDKADRAKLARQGLERLGGNNG
jgi:integrase